MNELLVSWYLFVNSNIEVAYDLLIIGVLVWLVYKVTGLQQDLQDEVDFNDIVGEGQRYVNTKLQDRIDLISEDIRQLKTKTVKKGKK